MNGIEYDSTWTLVRQVEHPGHVIQEALHLDAGSVNEGLWEWDTPQWQRGWAKSSVLVSLFTFKPVQIHLTTTTWTFHLKTVRNWTDYVLSSSDKCNVNWKQEYLKRTSITLYNNESH